MRAQFWSFDVIFAIVIFIISVSTLALIWYNLSSQTAAVSSGGVDAMQQNLQQLQSDLLSQGSPPDWSSVVTANSVASWSNVTVGLGNGSGTQLSMQKVAALEAMSNYDYQATKSMLGVGYDYYITIRTNSTYMRIGENPSDYNAVSEQVVDRPVIVGGRAAHMQVIVWTNTSFGVS